ncbi:MAG: diguanylate cyclase [Anaerolineales bacterium]|nr:diguanylate cyclase [Anaerolineales bacterium]
MEFVSPPNIFYSVLLLIAGVICLFVSAIIFQTRRTVPGASALMTLLSALSWWDISYAVFWADVPGPTPYFWLDITYLGVVVVPPALFIFSLQFSNKIDWLKSPVAVLLYIEPLIVLLILFTDPYHGLFFAGKRAENSAFILHAGPVFWFNVVFSYALTLFATIVLARAFLHSFGMYRRQIGIVFGGMMVTWFSSIMFILGIHPFPGADSTPFTFTITAVAFAYAMLRHHLLDVVPVARDVLVEKMSDGVLVIDDQNRVVDINLAARNLLNISGDVLGFSVEMIFSRLDSQELGTFNSLNSTFDIQLTGDTPTYLEVKVSPILGRGEKLLGRLVILHDITKLKDIQNELQLLASRDSLTGAVNRRHFMELAEFELARARRYQHSLALVLMDMDGFKKVNDTYGHQAGDQALLALKKVCIQGTRTVDIFARLGGEEFVLLMPETDKEAAAVIAERLRAVLENTVIRCDPHKFKVTISMGVTEYDMQKNDTLGAMLNRADKALYQAKANGRNQVLIWRPERNRSEK